MNRQLKTVLYVEDDSNDVVLLEHALRRASVEVRLSRVADGQEAIDYMSGQGGIRIEWLILYLA